MKYRLDLLPLRAFQGRGTPIGGRALRLWGYDEGGNWIATGDEVSDPNLGVAVPDNSGGWTAPAPAADSGGGGGAPADSGGGGGEPVPAAAPAPAPLAPANPWEQTVNDIYQQTFGRQADPSGMASFTAALNAGMTGEQMRAALASSPEGQSMGLSPAPAAPVAPLTAAAAQWEWQPSTTDDSSGMGMSSTTAPYWLDVNSGARQTADPVQYTGVTPVDTNTLPIQTAPNYEGTPTQFYDDQGNLQGVLVDTVKAGLGAKEGSLILDPTSLGLALKPGETPSIDSAIQQRNEQGQMLFIDPTTGGTTIYNTGVPALTGSTVKDLMYINDPGKRGGQIPTDTMQAALIAAAIATGGALAPEALGAGAAATTALTDAGLSASQIAALGAEYGTGSAAAVGAGAGADALTDVAATNLMSSGLLPAEMQIPASGVNWGAAATAAAKSAAINAAVTAAQGGKLNDILKAGALGAVSAGAGVAGADLLGGGTLAQIGAQTAVATATAAATGKDPVQAALTGALTATVANVIPASTSDILNGAGITDPSVQKAVNSAISSSIITAIKGGNVGTAALMGAVNSGLSSVAGMIGNSQVVQDIKANITNALTSTVDSIKYETGITNAQALPVEGSNRAIAGTPLDTATQPDVVNSILQQDAQDAMNRNVPPPLVQNAIDQNTPKTADNVVTPPLIQQATGQSDPNAIYNQLVANYGNSTVGAPLGTVAGATTNDANPLALSGNTGDTTAGGFLGEFKDLAPAKVYGSAVPQVDDAGKVITYEQPAQDNSRTLPNVLMNLPTEIRDQALGIYEVAMNQLGFVVGNVAAAGYGAGQTWYNLATGEPVDPAKINEISNEIAKRLSYTPQTEAGQVLAQAIPEAINSAMGSSMGLPPVTNLAALPTVGTIPTPNLGLLGGDVSNAIANVQRGITMEGPKSFGTTVGETIGGLLPKIDSTGAAISETGALSNATTPMLGYSPTETRANPLTSDRIESLRQALITPDYEINPTYPTTPATQLAPESRGALPTTLAEPSINPINLGPNIDSGTVAKINTEAQAVDQNLSNLSSPQVQAQAKTFVDNAYTALADKTPSAFTANSLGDIYGLGGTSNDVVAATKSVVENKAASPDTILKQVDQAIAPLNPDEQLPAKLAMLSNASKLGITPAEAINLGLLNNNGKKTELGEKVSPTPQPQPQPQPQPEPVAPLTPVKPVLPPPPTINPPPPSINPPPSVNPPIDVNPVNPVVNPTVNPVNPPAVDVNPPIPTPPPLVQAAITPPTATPKVAAPATTMTPSYMYGTGTQGTTIGALPGNLQATFLQGANVKEYNPFENYDKYQQLAPIHAAQGGSPLQLAQMQQGIAGVDPSLYNVLQKRQAPSYFTYGQDTSGGNPTTFAGSQLLGKPTPNIPVIPTGQKSGSDWLYQGSGTNPLAMAGTGIPSLGAGTMAHGGQAHDGGEGEHIPEFITGATGHYVKGRGDGQSDDIPAMLADGEYVFDAETVAQLGNGSSDAGAAVLDKMREAIRHHKRSAPIDSIPPKSKSPLEYLAEATKGKGKHHG